MSEEWIRRLVQLVEESDIYELEYSKFGRKIRISKGPSGTVSTVPATAAAMSAPAVAPAAPIAASDTKAAAAPAPEPVLSGTVVKSPIVGTFYRSPAPGEAPFVKVGDRVEVGQALCIIEAMKIMNEIESDVAGIVKDIYIENAQAVEYNTSLFRIE